MTAFHHLSNTDLRKAKTSFRNQYYESKKKMEGAQRAIHHIERLLKKRLKKCVTKSEPGVSELEPQCQQSSESETVTEPNSPNVTEQ